LARRIGRVIGEALVGLQRVTLVVLSMYLTLLVVIQVIVRYFLRIPFVGGILEELCIFVIFWFYFLGAVYSTYNRTYIQGGVVETFFKNSRVQGYFKVGKALICLATSCLFAVWGYSDFLWNLKVNRITMMLFLPEAFSYLSIFVGFAMMSLYFLTESIESVRGVLRIR
jgi:TRAP-type C4-dicarboxylate transport system permease small subunit